LKILLCHNFYQLPGGEDIVFANEGALLESHGHQVIRYQRHNDDVSSIGRVQLLKRTIWNQQTVTNIGDLIRADRPDIIHCHNTFPLISPAVYHAAKSLNVPVVQTLHNYRLICPQAQLLRDGTVCEKCVGKSVPWPAVAHGCYRQSRAASAAITAMLGYHWRRKTWTQSVDRYIAPSEFTKAKYIEGGFPGDKITVKPNFVNVDPAPGNGSGDFAIFVGRLSHEKGVQSLLDAWGRLKGDQKLKILGDGPLAETVANAAAQDQRIEWMGPQSSDVVLSQVGNAKFLIMPSIWFETFGLTMIEAFAKGTPVLAAKIGTMEEIVTDGQTGLFFAPGQAADLAKAVQQYIDNPAVLQSMRGAARREFEQKYTAQANYEALINIYHQAIDPIG
jgi:glycosyltransferase involved in cell wall biosynthesis